MALGIGGAWAAGLRTLEPYRPALIGITLALLVLAFYRAYRRPIGSCDADGSCGAQDATRMHRTRWWAITPVAVAVLALPYVARHLHCGGAPGLAGDGAGGTCCAVPPDESAATGSAPQTQPAEPIDLTREIVFKVESLQCPAVKGVGCGSMLAPVLAQLDHVAGVSRSFSNWTGTQVRISTAPGVDRDGVAERVGSLLSRDQRQPVRVEKRQLSEVLRAEHWYSATGLVDLSSYEFHSIARRRLAAFADAERLDPERREKLLKLVDSLWERSAQGLDLPGPGSEAYGQYWHTRLDQFIGAYSERARDVLTPEQVEKLLRQYHRRAENTSG